MDHPAALLSATHPRHHKSVVQHKYAPRSRRSTGCKCQNEAWAISYSEITPGGPLAITKQPVSQCHVILPANQNPVGIVTSSGCASEQVPPPVTHQPLTRNPQPQLTPVVSHPVPISPVPNTFKNHLPATPYPLTSHQQLSTKYQSKPATYHSSQFAHHPPTMTKSFVQ